MRGRKLDITGRRFGKLTAIKISENRTISGRLQWECRCDCGNIVFSVPYDLTSLRRKSCGCSDMRAFGNKTHGMTNTPTYISWVACKVRCYNPEHSKYPYYGGRGITVCDRWLESFENFLEDMGERPEGTSLNRIKDANIYSKETCEWATKSFQQYDQRRSSDNTSGRTGVRWDKRGEKWLASISKDKKVINLGRFKTFEEAVKAREEAEMELYGYIKEVINII